MDSQKAKRRKQSFTLVEVVLSLFLIGILLTGIFQSVRQVFILQKKTDKSKETLLENTHFQWKLNQIFSQVCPLTNGIIYFYTDPKDSSLYCSFDHGNDPNPFLNGPLMAKIYIEDRSLCLSLWNYPFMEKKKAQKTVLIQEIDGWNYSFLTTKNHHAVWVNEWKKGQKIPSVLTIEILKKGKRIPYAFFLPMEQCMLIDQKEGLAS